MDARSDSSAPLGISLEARATWRNFDETAYLAANPDVARAVRNGWPRSGRMHFVLHGRKEGRRLRWPERIGSAQEEKLARIECLLDLTMAHQRRGPKYDFLTETLRQSAGICDTDAVSSHDYDAYAMAVVEQFRDGVVLDCGAGRRPIYFRNVVNFEIVDYDTTDVLGIGEQLPFKDCSFDAVLSLAVLEHVRDPFACAAEIIRVLKPGGKLVCCVPFLQPLHGYPHHYYNMSSQGLRALFEPALAVDDHLVIESILPVWTLTWIVQSWAKGLGGKARKDFLDLRLRDLLAAAPTFLNCNWVRELPHEKNFELASATMLLAHKPQLSKKRTGLTDPTTQSSH